MKKAVIQTGGKQYLVRVGQVLKVEKLPGKVKAVVEFNKVLAVMTGETVKLGQPYLDKTVVKARVVRQGKARKVTGVKMKPKKRHKQYFGHRQAFTEIEIESLVSG